MPIITAQKANEYLKTGSQAILLELKNNVNSSIDNEEVNTNERVLREIINTPHEEKIKPDSYILKAMAGTAGFFVAAKVGMFAYFKTMPSLVAVGKPAGVGAITGFLIGGEIDNRVRTNRYKQLTELYDITKRKQATNISETNLRDGNDQRLRQRR